MLHKTIAFGKVSGLRVRIIKLAFLYVTIGITNIDLRGEGLVGTMLILHKKLVFFLLKSYKKIVKIRMTSFIQSLKISYLRS